MTFKEIIEEVITDLDEELTDADVVNKVKRFINRGYKNLAVKENLEKVATKYANDGKISSPADCLKVNTIMQNGTYIPFRKDGKYIYVLTDGRCDMNYVFTPEPLEYPDDETLTNEANIEYVMNFAKWKFLASEGMTQDAQMYRNMVDTHKVVSPVKIIKTIDELGVN